MKKTGNLGVILVILSYYCFCFVFIFGRRGSTGKTISLKWYLITAYEYEASLVDHKNK